MRGRRGMMALALAVALIAVVVPLAMMLAAQVLVPRMWAARARRREELGYRAVMRADGAVDVTRGAGPGGTRLVMRSVVLPDGGRYGVVVQEGGAGALICEGRGDAKGLLERAARQWGTSRPVERDDQRRVEAWLERFDGS